MGSNILIVESKNDQHFFNAIIGHLNCNIEIAPPILISDEDYLSMDGLDPTKLEKALKDLRADIQKGEIDKIGIIIDIDEHSKEDRINFINQRIQVVFPGSPLLDKTNEFIALKFEGFDVRLACYFTNVGGKGELETVLKGIKKRASIYADCLESWRNCLQSQNQTIATKEFDKFWVSMYLRFDTCSENEKRQAERKCSMRGFEYVMKEKSAIWDFDNPILDDFKQFLKLFC